MGARRSPLHAAFLHAAFLHAAFDGRSEVPEGPAAAVPASRDERGVRWEHGQGPSRRMQNSGSSFASSAGAHLGE